MNAARLKIPLLVLIVLSLLISAASFPNPQARWIIETIDAPMYFDRLSSSMLKFDDEIPTMAFGGDHLYLRYWNSVSTSRVNETLDDSPGVGSYASLAKDNYGHTFISYFDSINQTLKFATPSNNILFLGWEVDTIDATVSSGKGDLKLAYTRLFNFLPLLKKP